MTSRRSFIVTALSLFAGALLPTPRARAGNPRTPRIGKATKADIDRILAKYPPRVRISGSSKQEDGAVHITFSADLSEAKAAYTKFCRDMAYIGA
jgi:hypothetical protein